MIPTEFEEKIGHESHIFAFVCVCPFVCFIYLSEQKWRENERGEGNLFFTSEEKDECVCVCESV